MNPLQRRLARPSFVTAALLSASLAFGAPPSPSASTREAGKHFQRAVTLFNEADYNAALVEFKRAHDLAPNPHVLYNIGQTHYQLQDYAAAIGAFEAYLAEAQPASHRAEVESVLETLRARVGRLEITADAPNAEVSVDDRPVGHTPFAKPVLVSVGRRKVTATAEGRAPITRYVEVPSGETLPLALTFVAPAPPGVAPSPATAAAPAPSPDAARGGERGSVWPTVALVSTGVLLAGTGTMGVLAYLADRDAVDKRDSYPVDRAELKDAQSRARTFALVTDVLGAATVVAGGAALYLTLTRKDEPNKVQVGAAPGALAFRLNF
ncbi:MAG TPA: PEGA domain-containing protein [Polyangiaceae bacterium]|nr:PEGA domain-containing protein [Polyangiaceae bacterium]